METTEPEEQKDPLKAGIVQYFIKITRTMFLGFFWMLINVFLGLFLGFAVPDESTPGRMIFFYTWAVLTLAAYVYVVWRWWRKKIDV
ncbi:MAG TPA: hypothetical protein VFS25_17830 [Chitinophaga sp.]|jgi:membrane protein DedA with SNARE-associated domain|uniref:hypothetical protein n=1 Tax=Chitinophaga sp. TaxID=1869181 RepID=UPI002DB5CF9E|nr:hypothetical protein [Chitinophaga sp.]HEU4554712.1 hypothetical protein [Chitinophaga sp.]